MAREGAGSLAGGEDDVVSSIRSIHLFPTARRKRTGSLFAVTFHRAFLRSQGVDGGSIEEAGIPGPGRAGGGGRKLFGPSDHDRRVAVSPSRRFRLRARVGTHNVAAIRPILARFVESRGTLKEIPEGFEIDTEVEGPSARELNRRLLSELRRTEKRTRLRSEWVADGVTERFFDYVPKGPVSPPAKSR